MKIKDVFRLLTLAFMLANPALAGAQTSSSASDDSQPAESAPLDSQAPSPHPQHWEVTVTATRTPTSGREIGQALNVITAEDIEAQGARDVLQVLETVPGFNVARTGSFGGTASVFVRGGESDFNLVLIDGVQVNQAGGAFDFADLTTNNVERIEIVRGPSSVLYGTDAVTSVINIITRKGEGQPSANLQFEGGNLGSYLLRGGFQGGTDKIQYSFGTHYSRSDGLFDLNNQYHKLDLSGQTAFQLNPSSSLSANLRFTDSEFHFPTDSTGAVLDPNDFRETNATLLSISWDNLVSDRYGTKVHYGFYRKDSTTFSIQDDIVDFFDNTNEITENRNFLDWENNFQLNPNHLLTGGVSFEREASESGSLARRSVGVFLQEQFSWANRFFVTAGARIDHNNRFQSFSTASVSFGYLLDDSWKVRASLGNGFRAPSFVEIIGFPEFGILGNKDLIPEKNLAADWGIDFFSSTERGHFSATVFFNRFSDLIEFSFLVPPGTPNYINVEKAESQGLELEASVKPTEIIRLGGQYTLTDTEVTDSGTVPGGLFVEGEQLLRRPRHLAGAYAEFLKDRYKLRIDFKYKGARDDLQFFPDFSSARVVLPSYLKVDFSVTVPISRFSDSGGDMALLLRGENIFDKKYTEIAGFESLGRSLFAGLAITF